MRKNRVSDGVRTRDNRNHNPGGKQENQLLAPDVGARTLAETRPVSPVVVPGPGSLALGTPVLVTAGQAKGKRGVVRERVRWDFGGIPQYAVELPFPDWLRILRADYLQVAS